MNRRTFALLTAAAALPRRASAASSPNAWIEEIRKNHGVPALAGGIVTTAGLGEHFWTGVRKAGGTTPVTAADLWHIGSMTKAMTATLLGTWVAQGKLRWQSTLGSLIPRLLEKAAPEVRGITLEQLLTHRSGFRANREPWGTLPAAGNRSEIVRIESARALEHAPGGAFLYSNLGYMIAGVVAEKLGGKIWEFLMRERLFAPLKMKAGFGGTGTPGKEDQPWPHGPDGKPHPANGPEADNPPSLGPAGTCHASMQEYAKFVADHLRGAAGEKALLPATIYKDLHAPSAPGTYALGWET